MPRLVVLACLTDPARTGRPPVLLDRDVRSIDFDVDEHRSLETLERMVQAVEEAEWMELTAPFANG